VLDWQHLTRARPHACAGGAVVTVLTLYEIQIESSGLLCAIRRQERVLSPQSHIFSVSSCSYSTGDRLHVIPIFNRPMGYD